jgi:heat shock protein HslJ
MEKTMDIRRRTLVGAVLVLMALLAACSTATQDQAPEESAVLPDTEWVLSSLNGNALIEGTEITLNFTEASVQGSAGCNTYSGSYTASEDSLRLSGMEWTEMGCPEPAGILEQEQAYLQALNAAASFRVDGDRLEVYDEGGAQSLVFVAAGGPSSVQATPMPEPRTPTAAALAAATHTPVPPTVTPTPEPPTAAPPSLEPPAGFKRYMDAVSGVSLLVPESWTIVEPGPRGGPTIFASYPGDKYVGGEGFQPGDTKCDLTIHPPDISVADLVQQIKSDPSTTIVSEQEILLQSNQPGIRFEVESMGRSLSLITEINGRAVVLTCFGELAPFDQIAVTLGANQ